MLALGILSRDAMLLHGLFCGMSDEEADALFTEGMALAERLGEPTARIRMLNRLAARKNLTGIPEKALTLLDEARRRALETGDPFLDFLTRFSLSNALVNLGRLADGLDALERLEAVCAADPDYGAEITGFNVYGYLLSVHGIVLSHQGRPLLGAGGRAQSSEPAPTARAGSLASFGPRRYG